MIRVEKANEYVYHRLEEILNDDNVFDEMMFRVNREHEIIKGNVYKERNLQEKEREKITNRIMKNHKAYEDGLITKDEFLTRKTELEQQMKRLRENANF